MFRKSYFRYGHANNAAFPRIGQQRRDGDQAERGGRESGVIKFAGSSKIPERLPVEARRHQENFAMLRHYVSEIRQSYRGDKE
jgi:hypothetical protein